MDNNSNNNNVQRYQASSTNLNTVISNPTVNINDTMNMNIQNMSSNQGINNTANGNVNSMINPSVTAPNIPVNSGPEPTNKYINTNINNNNNTVNSNININNNNVNTINTSNMSNVAPSINRTYVTNEVKPKKRNTSIKMGSEFKTALFNCSNIINIYIVFLPIISDLIH
ncbi:MAG: hypothetical protein L6V91_04465 [Bacilli bacterium]|nr:MAG: hypothetical protein L6V91_04465 [Bacilli bacterium]